ncbi:MAG TPA: hypothetical protein VGG20_11545 [Thermoanaerobaculia bacterium]|jgi:hypothetical protein
MPRKPVRRLLGLAMSLLLTACAAYQAQHAPPPAAPSAAGEPGEALPEAAHPEGNFTALSDGAQISRIKGEVEQTKANLAQKGQYACCVRPACTECLLKYGHCHCRDAVRKAGPCCGECTEGWIEGKGAVEGVTAWEVLERKKKILEDANGKAGREKPQGEKQRQER